MALKKSQLYSSLWQSCDELRGGMDASQYKDYVLTLLFMKYVSDRYAGQPDALIEVPEGGGFADMAKLKGDKEIGDRINTIIGRLAEALIKTLVVEDKWSASIRTAIEGEVQQITQQLAGRVKALDERHARPLPELEREVEVFSEKVEGHLRQMGLSL